MARTKTKTRTRLKTFSRTIAKKLLNKKSQAFLVRLVLWMLPRLSKNDQRLAGARIESGKSSTRRRKTRRKSSRRKATGRKRTKKQDVEKLLVEKNEEVQLKEEMIND